MMSEALKLAQDAFNQDEVPVGAVIVLEGKIIGRGYNLRESTQDPLAHAEIVAIRDASKQIGSWRLLESELFVTLEPCPMCLGAIQQARVKKVIYGAKDPKGGALSLGYKIHQDDRLNHRFSVEFVETRDSEKLLKNFFQTKRKQEST